ncbi:aminoacyl-tRNA hydrolase [Chitinivibrio alkaliphilus]|uniref:Peptidyl-tRNA hydrolase n=1 Tax=Chitinivibrio alkaliphilus ACht1 TaxID=1313304 RepID=U7D8S2_9BACT|nr:aminoacyl-tRNA hydrolase [Chitinivibrio alkaliphilus]ERP31497.1 peptidyl-tRNA hydrolase [Chitinivibrio alkaliphilus ACht1]
MSDLRHVLVGIGNPGKQYECTRHNAGFMVLDTLRSHPFFPSWEEQECGFSRVWKSHERGVLIVQPETYVNRTGVALAELLEKYDVSVENLLVLVDDFNLPLGTIRFRRSGGDGGHNGLKSLIEYVGECFARLRIGIGPVPVSQTVVDFVLGEFSPDETDCMVKTQKRAAEACTVYFDQGIDRTMNRYNC